MIKCMYIYTLDMLSTKYIAFRKALFILRCL